MVPITSDPSRHDTTPERVRRCHVPFSGRGALVAGLAAATALLFEPARSLAATTTDCPNPVVPESPAGPAVLIVAALGALALVAWRRRRSGLAATVVSSLAIVILWGALVGTMLVGAATATCSGGTTSGGVLPAQTTIPFTGADIPWITAGVLILAGTVVTSVSRRRRRSRQG